MAVELPRRSRSRHFYPRRPMHRARARPLARRTAACRGRGGGRPACRAASEAGGTAPWWKAGGLQFHLLVWDVDTPREALYTTSTRKGGGEAPPSNAIVAFQSAAEAERVAALLTEQVGAAPTVEPVGIEVVELLAAYGQCEVEPVPAGLPWTMPERVTDWERGDELAVSPEELMMFTHPGGMTEGEPAPAAGAEEEGADVNSARARAALTVRAMIVQKITKLGAALEQASGGKVGVLAVLRLLISQEKKKAAGDDAV